MTQWFLDNVVTPVLTWLRDMVTWSCIKVFKLLSEGLLSVLNALPVPSSISDAGSAFSSVPSGVAYFLSAFNLSTGLYILFTALLLRFLIRRIPFIG